MKGVGSAAGAGPTGGAMATTVSARGARPADPTLNSLSIYLSTGQLLVLPFVIVLITRQRDAAAVATLAVTMAVHFVPYARLYAAPVYVVVAAVVALGTAVLFARDSPERLAGPRICALTGATLLLGAAVALIT